MTQQLNITLLPAREGDCLWISYGEGDALHSVMIDGGKTATTPAIKKRIDALSTPLELIVISHIDRDHLEGFLALAEDSKTDIPAKDIWFNDYRHLEGQQIDSENFEAKQGERLTKAIIKRGYPWNKQFEGRAVECVDDAAANTITLAGGATITLLSPSREKLEALLPDWEKACIKAGLISGSAARDQPGYQTFAPPDIEALAADPYKADEDTANGASIAFLFEYAGKRVLFAGDAHADQLIAALTPHAEAAGGRLKLDAFKLSHHGSRFNLPNELLALIDCDNYLISSNGKYFHHPDRVALSRILKNGGDNVRFHFNYKSADTLGWDKDELKAEYGYEAIYPDDADEGELTLSL